MSRLDTIRDLRDSLPSATNSHGSLCTIYILRLVSGKYYVGRTKDPNKRIQQHFSGSGSQWSQRYQPVQLEEIIPNCDWLDEDKHTKRYMMLYGIQNVRGGSYASIELDEMQIESLVKEFHTAENRCFTCGTIGHFVTQCRVREIKRWKCYQCIHKNSSKNSNDLGRCGQCGNKNPYIDDESTEDSEDSYESTEDSEDSYESSGEDRRVCYRCGRSNHFVRDCNAKWHVEGYRLRG
jgi:hypothetical protein